MVAVGGRLYEGEDGGGGGSLQMRRSGRGGAKRTVRSKAQAEEAATTLCGAPWGAPCCVAEPSRDAVVKGESDPQASMSRMEVGAASSPPTRTDCHASGWWLLEYPGIE